MEGAHRTAPESIVSDILYAVWQPDVTHQPTGGKGPGADSRHRTVESDGADALGHSVGNYIAVERILGESELSVVAYFIFYLIARNNRRVLLIRSLADECRDGVELGAFKDYIVCVLAGNPTMRGVNIDIETA